MDPNLLAVITGGLGILGKTAFDYFTKKNDLKVSETDKLRLEFKADLSGIQQEVTKWQSKYFEAYDGLLKAQNNNLIIQEKYNLLQEKFNLLQSKYDSLLTKVKVIEGQTAINTAANDAAAAASADLAHIVLPSTLPPASP